MELLDNAAVYAHVAALGVKDYLAYKADFLLSAAARIATSAVMIAVWTAVYAGSGASTIGGVGPQLMYAYFFFVAAFINITDSDVGWRVQSDIVEGHIAGALLKPINYSVVNYFYEIGASAVYAVAIAVPLIAIGTFLTHAAVDYSMLPLLVVELLLARTIAFEIDFIAAMQSVYFGYVGALFAMSYALISLLGGGLMPLTLYPHGIRWLLSLLPFQYMAFVPAGAMTGMVSAGELARSLVGAAAWALALGAAGYAMWNRIRRSLYASGG